MAFRFKDLTTELALEIIRFAAMPDYLHSNYDESSHGPYYTSAVRLSYVSHFFRRAVMPHILDTVILSSHRDHLAFSKAFLLQQRWRRERSRVALDYPRYIRRFWSSFCHPTIAGQWHISTDELDFDLFAEILCNVEMLGFAFNSLHLLYLSLANKNTGKWKCRKLVFAGASGRWNPLISSPEGIEFLEDVTHLAVWSPQMHYDPAEKRSVIPPDIRSLPFDVLTSLNHFGCTLWDPDQSISDWSQLPEKALVYGPRELNERSMPEVRERLRGDDPLKGGIIVPFREALGKNWWPNELKAWEETFMEGYAEDAWAQGDK